MSGCITQTSRIISENPGDRRNINPWDQWSLDVHNCLACHGSISHLFLLARLLRKNYRSREPWKHSITTPCCVPCTKSPDVFCTSRPSENSERMAELVPHSMCVRLYFNGGLKITMNHNRSLYSYFFFFIMPILTLG
ncbi:hypothetical protein BDV38DRAFT_106858 [Aspergillus pseudotamarii]|uniref:Uncharacterized protein n=1 Tax=Aspergillus pseudotamarii TaxID=132259 RepID=A0A5N6SQH1_ASPPS|nr:uncharacterized protein BDV38DRAFT_106858 [Aspergillus pseudotamarii]KAE8136938.1 hypothetical protein BDV38DRAFT_106858 [Aspergillus pseudotamarii]